MALVICRCKIVIAFFFVRTLQKRHVGTTITVINALTAFLPNVRNFRDEGDPFTHGELLNSL